MLVGPKKKKPELKWGSLRLWFPEGRATHLEKRGHLEEPHQVYIDYHVAKVQVTDLKG